MKNLFVAIASCMLLSGCAYFTVQPIEPGDNSTKGLRVYDVKPLLVVSSKGADVITVPDPSRAYAVRFGTFLAKHDVDLELGNGVLTKIGSKQDSTDVPLKLIDLVTEAVKSGNPLGAAFSKSALEEGDLAIYEIIFDLRGNITDLKPLLRQDDFIRIRSSKSSTSTSPTKKKKTTDDKKDQDKKDVN